MEPRETREEIEIYHTPGSPALPLILSEFEAYFHHHFVPCMKEDKPNSRMLVRIFHDHRRLL